MSTDSDKFQLITSCLRCIVDALDGLAERGVSAKKKAKLLRDDVDALDEAYQAVREDILGRSPKNPKARRQAA